jgi:hypothetical protein
VVELAGVVELVDMEEVSELVEELEASLAVPDD